MTSSLLWTFRHGWAALLAGLGARNSIRKWAREIEQWSKLASFFPPFALSFGFHRSSCGYRRLQSPHKMAYRCSFPIKISKQPKYGSMGKCLTVTRGSMVLPMQRAPLSRVFLLILAVLFRRRTSLLRGTKRSLWGPRLQKKPKPKGPLRLRRTFRSAAPWPSLPKLRR